MSTPLTDGINALTAYANEITGASDTTLSDAVGRLCEEYGGVANGSVTTDKLADGAVTTAKIADGAITAGKIASGVIPAVDTTLTQTGAAADAKVVGDELSEIKGNLGSSVLSDWDLHYYIKLDVDNVDVTNPIASYPYRCLVVDCTEGDIFYITAESKSSSVHVFAFIDATGTKLIFSGTVILSFEKRILVAPQGATKLVINDYITTPAKASYKGVPAADATRRVISFNDDMSVLAHGEIELEDGVYYYSSGVIIGTSKESGCRPSNKKNARSAYVNLVAGNILKISSKLGSLSANSTRSWRAYNAETGILVAISENTSERCVKYLCFDIDVHVYYNTNISDENYYLGIVKANSALYDIYKENIEPHLSILDLNEDAVYAIKTMRRPERTKTRPFILCHFSDLHADTENLSRIADFFEGTNGLIDAKICTGDMVLNSIDDGMQWWDTITGTADIMLTVGNHEAATGTGSVSYNTATPAQVYQEVFAGRISNWGVTQPPSASENGLGYYYKDYSTQKIRLIVLDINHDATYKSTQLEWLVGCLNDARTRNYAVIIANHYHFARDSGAEKMDCTFNPGHEIIAQTNNWYIPADYEQAVDDFIDAGGEFVCWLSGHTHQDYVMINSSRKQICITVTTANFANANSWSFGDDYREAGTRSQDAFNVVSIDTYSKNISIYRVGNDLSRLMQPRHRLCLDYANKKIIWSD